MRTLRNKSQAPPEFFSYTHAETGHTTQAMDYPTWVSKAIEHRRANSLPIPDDFEFQMQDQLCSKIPPELCDYQPNDPQWVNPRLSWNDVFSAAQTFLSWKLNGSKFVSLEEAERRANICSGCHLNVRIGGCGGLCRQVSQIIMETKEDRKTSYDSNLLNCAVCKCPNASQVHFSLTTLEVGDTPQRQAQYVPQCWKKKESPNYRPND